MKVYCILSALLHSIIWEAQYYHVLGNLFIKHIHLIKHMFLRRMRLITQVYGSVLVEGEVENNTDDWLPFVEPFILFGCLTVEVCMDKHILLQCWNITSSLYRMEQSENKGYHGRHNVKDMIAMISIAFDFWHPFLW